MYIQLGWGWPGSNAADAKVPSDPSMAIPPLINSYQVPQDSTSTQVPG